MGRSALSGAVERPALPKIGTKDSLAENAFSGRAHASALAHVRVWRGGPAGNSWNCSDSVCGLEENRFLHSWSILADSRSDRGTSTARASVRTARNGGRIA